MKKLRYVTLFSSVVALSALSADDGSMPSSKSRNMNSPMMMKDPGEIQTPDAMQSGYNTSAGYQTSGWDVFITAAALYWHASSDGLNYGVTDVGGDDAVFELAPFTEGYGKVLTVGGSYRPGFKVGFGFKASEYDDWTLYSEYTWYHHDYDVAKGVTPGTEEIIVLETYANNNPAPYASSARFKWRYHLNWVDLLLGRAYYVSPQVVLNPFIGLRGGWFKNEQKLTATAVDLLTLSDELINPLQNTVKANSWKLGPRFGVNTTWLLGMGFRVLGNAAGSICFTRYTTISQNETRQDVTETSEPIVSHMHAFDTVRFDTEFDLGLGWGSYLYGEDYHIDFSATYDFNILWNENMPRFLTDTVANVSKVLDNGFGYSPSNIYLHGLTVRARFDF